MKKDKEWFKQRMVRNYPSQSEIDNPDYEIIAKVKIIDEVLSLIDQLDEPELPVIPQFVASAIEKTKENRKDITILNIFNEVTTSGFYTERVDDWVLNNPDVFTRAWLDGYTIEKEPAWTVKLDKGRYVDNFVEFAVGIQIDITSKLDCTAPIIFKDKSKAEAVALLVGGEVVEVTE